MPSALAFLEGTPVQAWRWRAFRLSFAIFGLALFAATWWLWTPQAVFPQVPLVAIAGRMPQSVESMLIIVVVAALAASIVDRLSTASYLAFSIATTLLFLVDQHRLQPWAFQFVVVALVLAALPPPRAFVLLRWLVVSIYLWSAIAKLDATFINTLGQQFLAALVGTVGASTQHWSPAARNLGAWLFPLSEIGIASGFALPLARWTWPRRIVLALAVAMHVCLILLLSPLGLAHLPAVLVWNGWFIVQALLLFGFPAKGSGVFFPTEIAQQRPPTPLEKRLPIPLPRPWLAELAEVGVELLVALVIALPVLNLIERYDHWLAWGLYAPRNSRVNLYVARDRVAAIDPSLQQFVVAHSDSDWAELRLDTWSLMSLRVPIYPQDRFQLGVAEAVIREQRLDGHFRIVMQSPADRWTGRRQQQTISTRRELDAAQAKFFFKARPR